MFLLALGVALPGANFQLFNGLPFDSLGEAIAAVALVPLVFSPPLRTAWSRSPPICTRARLPVSDRGRLRGPRPDPARAPRVGVEGFRGVLRLAGGAAPVRTFAERSYSNLFDRYQGATRIDPSIAFGARTGTAPPAALTLSTWNLSFVDDLRYDLPAAPRRNRPARDRAPIQGPLDRGGERASGHRHRRELRRPGRLGSAGQTRLPHPTRGPPSRTARGGRRPALLPDLLVPGATQATGSYAAVRVAYAGGAQVARGRPARPRGSTRAHVARVLAFLDDALLAVLFALIVVGQALAIGKRDRVILLTVGAAGWLVLAGWSPWREAVFVRLAGRWPAAGASEAPAARGLVCRDVPAVAPPAGGHGVV